MTQPQARELVKKYGQNPLSYLTLEDDKTLFFGKGVEGVVAYGTCGSTVVALGDPICAPEDVTRLLEEFSRFCNDARRHCIFMGTTDVFLDKYDDLGSSRTRCGEEARFRLSGYGLSGKKMTSVRKKVNRSTNEHVTVHEYKPSTRSPRRP